MKTIPHIDIVEPERIDALLADPANFAWRAIDSETLDTWTPDLGVTNYVRPSIVRRGSVATSGVASTLRHRFWGTVEKQSDHTGRRYVGIVLYDGVGEVCPLEVRLGSAVIGRVEPTRHDNRRHLIVLDKAVDFVGEMEILQVTAPGPGAYRIEAFVLLHELSEPSTFLPTIENLTTDAQQGADDQWQGILHCTTAQPATLLVTAECPDETPRQVTVARAKTIHTVELPALAADRGYTITVVATEKSGTTATTVTQLSTLAALPNTQRGKQHEVVVPVELFNRATTDITGTPLTFGVPLQQGALYDPQQCQLIVPGYPPQNAQIQVQSRWPDGSVRWVFVDTVIPPGVITDSPCQGTLHFTATPLPPGELTVALIKNNEGAPTCITVTSAQLRVCVQTGDLDHGLTIETERPNGDWQRLTPPAGQAALTFDAILGNDLVLTSTKIDTLTVEETGQQRAVLKFTIAHRDASGIEHLRSTIRLHLYANSRFVKVVHRLAVVSPWLGSATGGPSIAASAIDAQADQVIYGHEGEAATLLKLRSFALQLPWAHGRSIQTLDVSSHTPPQPSPTSGREIIAPPLLAGKVGRGHEQALESRWSLADGAFHLCHEDDLGYLTDHGGDQRRVAGRVDGHYSVQGIRAESPILHFGIRHFWQRYPKGIHISDQGIRMELFPALTGAPLPGDEEAWHRLYFWLHEKSYLLKVGMALTNEILLGFTDERDTATAEAARWFAWLEQPPVARPATAYLQATGALAPFAAKTQMVLPAYERLVDQALASFIADREHFRAYGQLNFGDWYGESGCSWGNNEYDPAYCAYVEFLRGGVTGWATWGADAVRHLVDVDTINHSAEASELGGQAMHMPGHLGGYLPPLFHSKMAGTKSIPSHTWVEGPLLHYLLTGDRAAYDSIALTKGWLLQDGWFDHYEFSNCREAGWHLIHLCMIAAVTADRHSLNAAAVIVKRVLEREEPGGGWIHMLTESHCGCGYPRCRGEAGFMVGVLLSGLKRYHNLTGDARVAQAIIGGARWLIRATFDHATGHFRYTSCVNRTLGGGFQQTQWVLEGLAAAFELSGDREIGHYVQEGLKSIGRFPEGLDHLGLGKAMSQQMRYVPTVLAALEKRHLEES